jgi:hypothetical protein
LLRVDLSAQETRFLSVLVFDGLFTKVVKPGFWNLQEDADVRKHDKGRFSPQAINLRFGSIHESFRITAADYYDFSRIVVF